MNSHDIVAIFGIIFIFSLPIVAVLMMFITAIKCKSRDTDLRIALVQQGTDAETAKVIIGEQQKKRPNIYKTLRWGSIFVGAGLGALIVALLNLSFFDDLYSWFVVVGCVGMALLITFIIEYKLTKKDLEMKDKTEA